MDSNNNQDCNNGGKRIGSYSAGWKKKRSLLSEKEQRRRNKETFSQLTEKVENWYVTCEVPASFFAYYEDELTFYGNSESMRKFCADERVKKIFLEYHQIEGKKSDSYRYSKSELDKLSNWREKTTKEKQNLIRDFVKCGKIGSVNWKRSNVSWWPERIEFRNPSGSPKMSLSECDHVLSSFFSFNLRYISEKIVLQTEEIFSDTHCRYLLENVFRVDLGALKAILEEVQGTFPNMVSEVSSNDICFWARNSGVMGFDPINVKRDKTSFYRSISLLIFGNEKRWRLVKLGAIVFGMLNSQEILASIESTKSVDDFKSSLLTRAVSNDEVPDLVELVGTSGLIGRSINLNCHKKWKENSKIISYTSQEKNEKSPLNILKLGTYYTSKKADYYLPLIHLQSNKSDSNYADGNCQQYCIAPTKTVDFLCLLCGRRYHSICVTPASHRPNSCGCHRLPFMIDNNSLSWLWPDLENWFQQFESEIKTNIDFGVKQSPSRSIMYNTNIQHSVEKFNTMLTKTFPGFSIDVISDIIAPETVVYVCSIKEKCSRLCVRWLLHHAMAETDLF